MGRPATRTISENRLRERFSAALTFAFRPLWQMDAASRAAVALNKAQAIQIYAGVNLWPADAMARLAEDGTYPGAEAVFAGAGGTNTVAVFDPNQPRDPAGRWTTGGESFAGAPYSLPPGKQPPAAEKSAPSSKTEGALGWLAKLNPIGTASAQEVTPRNRTEALARKPPTRPRSCGSSATSTRETPSRRSIRTTRSCSR